MKIQYKKDYILIQTSFAKVIIGENAKVKAEDADIFISKSLNIVGDFSEKLIINSPGEYEQQGVMIQALPETGTSERMLFSIDIEGVNIVYVSSDIKEITKKIIDQIGVNNILITALESDVENLRDLVEDINPSYVIPMTRDAELLSKISKKLGLDLPTAEKTMSINEDAFEDIGDDAISQLFVLE